MSVFLPLQSMIGGVFIGTACGIYMLVASRIAGNSGMLKSLILGPRELTQATFVAGLLGGGAVMASLLPSAFAAPPPPSLRLALSGLSVGLGVALGNGCTSGHGLCGLSRCSVRSLVAVPTFMAAAIATATLLSGTGHAGFAPFGTTPDSVLRLCQQLAGALALALAPFAILKKGSAEHEAYAGLWSGSCFAVGLSVGGMVRPSVVTGALSPALIDLTLWTLFVTALVVTFCFYRVGAHVLGVKAASAWDKQPSIDSQLLVGATLFGVGWGSSGVCPGPHLVALPAASFAAGPTLMLAFVGLGIKLSKPIAAAAFGGGF